MKDKENLAVVTCFFDFAGNAKLKENFIKFYKNLKDTGVQVFVGEILSDNIEVQPGTAAVHSQPQLNEIVKENYFSLDIAQPFWCRENMINVMVDYFVPKSFSKIVWVDPNVIIDNKNWLDEMSEALEEKDFVQIGGEFLKLNEDGETVLKEEGGAKAYLNSDPLSKDAKNHLRIREQSNLGGGWGVKRDFFEKAGLFDLDFSGSGDALTFLSSIGSLMQNDPDLLEEYKNYSLELYYNLMSYNSLLLSESVFSSKPKIGYIDQDVKLLYSGDHSIREYNQFFDPSSLELLKHIDYGSHFILDKDRFNAEAGEHKPFYRTVQQAHLICQYFRKLLEHLRYKDAKDKISIQETLKVEAVERNKPKETSETPAPNTPEEVAQTSITIPTSAVDHLLKTWEAARKEVEEKKQEYERTVKREELIFEAFKKGMVDSRRS
jgi:hypothetical protein